MSSLQRIVLIGAGVILVAALVLGLSNSRKNWNWYLSYAHEDKNPYGMSVLYDLLPAFNDGTMTMVTEAPSDMDLTAYSGTYFSIGHQSGLTAVDLDSLAVWAARGNTVFLAHEAMPDYLPGVDSSRMRFQQGVEYDDLDSFFSNDAQQDQTFWQLERELPALRLNFTQAPFRTAEDHKLVYRVWNKDQPFPWSLMEADSLRVLFPQARTLGMAKGVGANLVELPLGQGRILIFTTPMALSNFYLVQPDGRDYAERVLSHLNPGDVLWDAGTRTSATPYQPAESPLRFVLNHPALRMAWYLLLLIGLLFLVFRSRRRQAAIPPLDAKSNQSLEYLNTVAQLHYQQRSDHRAIGEMLREQFLGFLRERFHLRQPGLTEETALRLSGLSGQDPAAVRSLFSRFAELETTQSFTDYSLLRLHRELRQFYERCT